MKTKGCTVQRVVLLFNSVPIVQMMKRLSEIFYTVCAILKTVRLIFIRVEFSMASNMTKVNSLIYCCFCQCLYYQCLLYNVPV